MFVSREDYKQTLTRAYGKLFSSCPYFNRWLPLELTSKLFVLEITWWLSPLWLGFVMDIKYDDVVGTNTGLYVLNYVSRLFTTTFMFLLYHNGIHFSLLVCSVCLLLLSLLCLYIYIHIFWELFLNAQKT